MDVKHRKLFICFSGIPLSGKTYIAKILEKKYSAIRINNDEIRKIIKRIFPQKTNEERQEILQGYLFWFLENYSFSNKLIILDSSIDRKYEKIKRIAERYKFKIFIITLKVSKKKLLSRVNSRNRSGREHFFNEVCRWFREYKQFNQNTKADIILKNEGNLNFNPLFEKLNNLIQ